MMKATGLKHAVIAAVCLLLGIFLAGLDVRSAHANENCCGGGGGMSDADKEKKRQKEIQDQKANRDASKNSLDRVRGSRRGPRSGRGGQQQFPPDQSVRRPQDSGGTSNQVDILGGMIEEQEPSSGASGTQTSKLDDDLDNIDKQLEGLDDGDESGIDFSDLDDDNINLDDDAPAPAGSGDEDSGPFSKEALALLSTLDDSQLDAAAERINDLRDRGMPADEAAAHAYQEVTARPAPLPAGVNDGIEGILNGEPSGVGGVRHTQTGKNRRGVQTDNFEAADGTKYVYTRDPDGTSTMVQIDRNGIRRPVDLPPGFGRPPPSPPPRFVVPGLPGPGVGRGATGGANPM